MAVLAAAMLLAMRRFTESAGPVMRERCSEMCDRMLANMPESFPPNRMMADLEVLTNTPISGLRHPGIERTNALFAERTRSAPCARVVQRCP